MKNRKAFAFLFAVLVAAASLFLYSKLSAHCDTLDGPVVKACKNALETGNVNFVLIWVQKKDEDQIREAFEKTLAVRKANPEAKELAEMYFFETVVRIHRAGEGASYTGLKPAGLDLGPAIPAGDRALINGSMDSVKSLLSQAMQNGLEKHFSEVMEKSKYDVNDVDAGRLYIKAYVEYIHYIEGLYEAAKNPIEGHYKESSPGEEH